MKKLIPVLLIVVLVVVGIWWWRKSSSKAAPDDEGDVKAVAAVQVAPLQNQPISRLLTAFGVVEASPQGARTIALGYDSVIRQVAAPAGSRVASGAPVLTVEPTPDAKLQMDSARGVEALAQRSLEAVRQRFELKLATGDDVRSAEQAALDAKLKLQSYAARGMDASHTINAPADAIVLKLDAQPGTIVPAGTALVTLGDPAHLQVRLGIEASDTVSVKAGQVVTLTAVGRSDADPVTSSVEAVGSIADPTTGSVDVRVALPSGTWIAGERVQGAIELEKKTTLVAPRSAVLPDDDQQILYTVADHKATKHQVQIGIANADLVEVISKDLHPGDIAVTQGNYELADGMKVQLPGEGDKDKPEAGKDESDKKGASDKPEATTDGADKKDAKDDGAKKAAPAAEDGAKDGKAAAPEKEGSKS